MREKNTELIKLIQTKGRCIVSGQSNPTPHHVKSVGAGGNDEVANLMPLSHRHHMEVHQVGLVKFAKKYPQVKRWLDEHNWRYDEFMNKYIRVTEEGWDE